MIRTLFAIIGLALSSVSAAALSCNSFAPSAPHPAPLNKPWAPGRIAQIEEGIRNAPHRILFFGDSIVRLFERKPAWGEYMEPRGVFNAGLNGDLTEGLLWRLEHGDIDSPAAVILLIGTNDLAARRSAGVIAESIRATVAYLRSKLPESSPVLLLGLLPRGPAPDARFRPEIGAVNRLIKTCADGRSVIYVDLGGVLLDQDGTLSAAMSRDHVHPTPAGYAKLGAALALTLDKVVPNNR